MKLKDGVLEHGAKNWKKIAAFVPGRTGEQCRKRWFVTVVSNIDPTTARTGRWTAGENKKLQDAVRAQSTRNWEAIAALIPGRTRIQCQSRWQDASVSKNPTMARACQWTTDEDNKLKDGVRAHGSKNWKAIAAFVPSRTIEQCRNRWYGNLASNIDPTTACAGKWTEGEDMKLKDGVLEHGAKNWKKIAAFVPGRTKNQCCSRWRLRH
jgi:myb proto-oncogene protein